MSQNKAEIAAYGETITHVEFSIGRVGAVLPMLLFIIWAIFLSIMNWISEGALILGMILAFIITLFFAKRPWKNYAEAIFNGMTVPIGVIAIICWFFAGMFAEVLKMGGLVDGLVWLGQTLQVDGGLFVGITFILAAAFASAVGTGYGTVIAFVTLMYPTGLAMGCDPLILLAAILSGAAFGDNLAPVSDTTIVSAVTQEGDIPGVVKSRFRYAIIAAVPALILFVLLGSASSPEIGEAMSDAAGASIKPIGLLLLIPFVLVIYLALNRNHIIVSLTWGIVCAVFIMFIMGLIQMGSQGWAFSDVINQLLYFGSSTTEQAASVGKIIYVGDVDGSPHLGGALYNGLSNYFLMAILVLLIVSAGHLMKIGGALQAILDFLLRFIRESVRRAEVAIWSMVTLVNVFITINTAAEIAVSSFVKALGDKVNLHPYRKANLLDAVSSALGYIFPWSGAVILAITQMKVIRADYPVLESIESFATLNFSHVFPYVFHGWFLLIVMLIAALTGFGRQFMQPKPKE
jgi:Na+/H+ antiporter NhaC